MHLLVMIVDDDPIFSLIAGALLKQLDIIYPTHICANGEEALQLLEKLISKDKIILIFLDITMPVLDGWGLLNALKDFPYKENIRVVMVTSAVNNADKEQALTYEPVIDYLVKPMKREDLLKLMQSKPLASFFMH